MVYVKKCPNCGWKTESYNEALTIVALNFHIAKVCLGKKKDELIKQKGADE